MGKASIASLLVGVGGEHGSSDKWVSPVRGISLQTSWVFVRCKLDQSSKMAKKFLFGFQFYPTKLISCLPHGHLITFLSLSPQTPHLPFMRANIFNKNAIFSRRERLHLELSRPRDCIVRCGQEKRERVTPRRHLPPPTRTAPTPRLLDFATGSKKYPRHHTTGQ